MEFTTIPTPSIQLLHLSTQDLPTSIPRNSIHEAYTPSQSFIAHHLILYKSDDLVCR